MRLVTVGTGTVVPDPKRASACHWVQHEGTRVIVDCGAGALQGLARAGLPWGEVDHLIISHFHADHIGEIPSLVFALCHGLEVARVAPLQVWGPLGTRRLFEAWAAALGSWLVEPGFGLQIHEMRPGAPVQIGTLHVDAAETPHTDESVALRIEAGGAALGYTGDTGPDEALAGFFRGVDLLLAECSLPEDLVADNHLSPERLARLAQAAGVERVAVTHVYPQLHRLDVPDLIRRAGYTGQIIMARDGLDLEV
jgi:ribonuclease BN (tRNA processing enzyme)